MKLTPYWLDSAPNTSASDRAAGRGLWRGGGGRRLRGTFGIARPGEEGGQIFCSKPGNWAVRVRAQWRYVQQWFCTGLCRDGQPVGTDVAWRLYQSFDAAVDTVERIIREEDIDCDFKRVGKLKLAAKPAHYDKLARSQELMARGADPDSYMVSRQDLKAELGSDRYFGGMIFPKSAAMHMGEFAHGLATAATRHGANCMKTRRSSA